MGARNLEQECRYSKGEYTVEQIIRKSFDIFLKRELQNVEKTNIMFYNIFDERPLISGGMICT